MSLLDSWMGPVMRVRDLPAEKDQYGDDIPGSGTTEETELPDALFGWGTSEEPVAAGATPVIHEPTAYWPDKWPDVLSTDKLRINGILYRVDGEPAKWPMGLSVTLKAVMPGG